jgi:hypothetical protein
MTDRAALVLLTALAASACSPSTQVSPVSWPATATVIRVVRGAVPVDAREAPRAVFCRYEGARVLAQTDSGATFVLPDRMASIVPGWVDGMPVTWDREACMLGGHVETVDGHHIVVDGGFCFDVDFRTWRVVRLSDLPLGLRPAYGDAAERVCRTLSTTSERVLQCSERSGGGVGRECSSPIPEHRDEGAYVLFGLR